MYIKVLTDLRTVHEVPAEVVNRLDELVGERLECVQDAVVQETDDLAATVERWLRSTGRLA